MGNRYSHEPERKRKLLLTKQEIRKLIGKTKELGCTLIPLKLYNKPVVIYGVSDFTEAVALRWKGQLTENGKVLAFASLLPEMNHNEIVGWDILKDRLKNFAAIFLRDDSDLARIKKRIGITKSIIMKRAGFVGEIYSSGNNLLARLMSLICLGDFTSIYVAILNKVDPTPVTVIDYLKKQLKK